VITGKAGFVDTLQALFASVASFRHTVTNVWNDVDDGVQGFERRPTARVSA
jgi:hypothetical protein